MVCWDAGMLRLRDVMMMRRLVEAVASGRRKGKRHSSRHDGLPKRTGERACEGQSAQAGRQQSWRGNQYSQGQVSPRSLMATMLHKSSAKTALIAVDLDLCRGNDPSHDHAQPAGKGQLPDRATLPLRLMVDRQDSSIGTEQRQVLAQSNHRLGMLRTGLLGEARLGLDII